MMTEMRDGDLYPATIDEMLGSWDSGAAVWSVEMGGLGPGYEQCIQVLAIELLRRNRELPEAGNEEAWRRWGEDTIRLVDAWPGFGLSGAQVGAAKNLAANLIKRGPRVALSDPAVKERRIQVSQTWPRAEGPDETLFKDSVRRTPMCECL